MTKASDNDYPSILLTEQGSAPTSPAASHQRLYIRTSDHTLVTVNSSGTVTPVSSGAAAFVGCSVSGTSTATNNSSVALAFASADTYDTDSIHDPASNNTRLTVPTGKTGKWRLEGYVAFGTGTSDRRIGWSVNGGSVTNMVRVTGSDGGSGQRYPFSTTLSLTAADYVEIVVFTDTSATQNPYAAQFTYCGA